MRIDVIPAILVKTEAEFRDKFAQVENVVPWVQLDVVDGKFAPNVTWGDPSVIGKLDTDVQFEIDLMVVEPQEYIRDWIEARAGRVFFHYEALSDIELVEDIAQELHDQGVEIGMSLNPETPFHVLEDMVPLLDALLFLGVSPGFGGQKLKKEVIENIAGARAHFPNIPIEVDGGVNKDTAKTLVDAGATRLAAGSFLFKHPRGPAAAIEEIRNAIREV